MTCFTTCKMIWHSPHKKSALSLVLIRGGARPRRLRIGISNLTVCSETSSYSYSWIKRLEPWIICSGTSGVVLITLHQIIGIIRDSMTLKEISLCREIEISKWWLRNKLLTFWRQTLSSEKTLPLGLLLSKIPYIMTEIRYGPCKEDLLQQGISGNHKWVLQISKVGLSCLRLLLGDLKWLLRSTRIRIHGN